MPETTYILRFVHNDGGIEYYEHNDREGAEYHLGLFDESDADIYAEIALIEHNWKTGEDLTIEVRKF